MGITNNIKQRLQFHALNGWKAIDISKKNEGQKVFETERQYKQWLKKNIGTIKGTTENWKTSKLNVGSLKELKKISCIQTDIF